MSKIFVTGATGTVGSQLVKALQQKPGVVITAASRTPATTAPTATANFDFKDPTTYTAADGHDAVFVLGPPLEPGLADIIDPFLDHLARHGQPRVTYLSALGMETLPELPFHQQMEAKLKDLPLAVTILRPGFFASNFGTYERENVEQRGILFNPAGAGKAAFIDPADVGAVAAETLTDPTHAGQVYELTGPATYSMHEMANLISEVTGKTIVYPEPSEAAYREALAAGGAPPFVADYMIPVYGLIRNGSADKVTPTVERILGRPATDVRTVLERYYRGNG